MALLVIAVAWPFMVPRGRGYRHLATMIYIIRSGAERGGGLSACWYWAMAVFTPSAPCGLCAAQPLLAVCLTRLPLVDWSPPPPVSCSAWYWRLRGDYLAIVTLGFGEIVRILLNNTEITGGPNGISQTPQTDASLV